MVKSDQIQEHMDVVGSDGGKVGKVDHLEGVNQIKLTKTDSADGKHHFIPLDWVAKVDAKVHLSKTATDAKAQWKDAA